MVEGLVTMLYATTVDTRRSPFRALIRALESNGCAVDMYRVESVPKWDKLFMHPSPEILLRPLVVDRKMRMAPGSIIVVDQPRGFSQAQLEEVVEATTTEKDQVYAVKAAHVYESKAK